MPSSPESDPPLDESTEESRRKERELAEAEVRSAHRERIMNRLRILQLFFSLIGLATGNPAYRWAASCAQWAMERFRDSE